MARNSWWICVIAGLATAGGALLDLGRPLYIKGAWQWFALYAGPGLFGAVFAWRLMKERALPLVWAGALTGAVIAAHRLAFEAVVYVLINYDPGVTLETSAPVVWFHAFVALAPYGATFAILFAAALAVRFREHLTPGSIALAVALCAVASLTYYPLSEVFPGMFFSAEAASITFALVFAATAAVYGRRLFVGRLKGGS
ncbi:MAG TPA: hypothetical protein VLA52_09535 [Thermohalobaculum sp.]|nr:hypothetical protein [Thermohalobaculum sp.]